MKFLQKAAAQGHAYAMMWVGQVYAERKEHTQALVGIYLTHASRTFSGERGERVRNMWDILPAIWSKFPCQNT